VRAGGLLVATPDVGAYDSLGRKRSQSVLWQALGLDAAPARERAVGRGKVVAPAPGSFAAEALSRARAESFVVTPAVGIEVVPYRSEHALVLHLVRHEAAARSVVLRLPESFHPAEMTAHLFVPGQPEPQSVPISAGSAGLILSLDPAPAYGVLIIPLSATFTPLPTPPGSP
jgi:hypothetical protein